MICMGEYTNGTLTSWCVSLRESSASLRVMAHIVSIFPEWSCVNIFLAACFLAHDLVVFPLLIWSKWRPIIPLDVCCCSRFFGNRYSMELWYSVVSKRLPAPMSCANKATFFSDSVTRQNGLFIDAIGRGRVPICWSRLMISVARSYSAIWTGPNSVLAPSLAILTLDIRVLALPSKLRTSARVDTSPTLTCFFAMPYNVPDFPNVLTICVMVC